MVTAENQFEVFMGENFKMLDKFCEKHRIKHCYSALRTPQQNDVVEK